VPTPIKLILIGLGLLCCLSGIGCNRGGSHAPPAAIDGSADNAPSGTAKAAKNPPKNASDPLHPVVLIETTLGNITLKLDAVKSPLTVDNFLTYVGNGHYDQTIIHQVFKGQGFMAGGYGVNGVEKPARTPILNEAHNGLKNLRGTIAMDRRPDAIDSAQSKFFINTADNPALDFKERTVEGYGYCVFGEVVEGMDVVDRINEAEVRDTENFERAPTQPIIIKSIRRIR
jgi:cyclophilin family peptidyl-prolyl cis-trans isomerase